MASSENQGLQIALIIFVILTIVLSVTTFLFFRQAEQAEAQASKDQENARSADTNMGEMVNNCRQLLQLSGYAGGDTTSTAIVTQAIAQFEQDKKAAMFALPAQDQTLRGAMLQFYALKNDLEVRLAQERAKSNDLETQLAQTRTNYEQQLKAAQDNLVAKTQELDALRIQFNDDRDRLNQELAARDANISQVRGELDATQTTATRDKENLTTRLTEAEQTKQRLFSRLASIDRQTFERTDGQIVYINQRRNVVWINRGSADNVVMQTHFTIWHRDTPQVDLNQSSITSVTEAFSKNKTTYDNIGDNPNYKGAIQITKILGPHLAEAEILEDNTADPILDGDQVYSPIWETGTPARFALVGIMDINGDGLDDRTLIRNLINQGGGTIDAEDTDTEERKLTHNTRYLVRGEIPPDRNQAQLDRWNTILKEANAGGVEVISVTELLDFLGFKGAEKMQQFGTGADSNMVPVPIPDGGFRRSTGRTSDLFTDPNGRGMFRPRRPPVTLDNAGPSTEEDADDAAPMEDEAAPADEVDTAADEEMTDEAVEDEEMLDEESEEEAETP